MIISTSAADQRFSANYGSTLSVHTNRTSQNISQYQYGTGFCFVLFCFFSLVRFCKKIWLDKSKGKYSVLDPLIEKMLSIFWEKNFEGENFKSHIDIFSVLGQFFFIIFSINFWQVIFDTRYRSYLRISSTLHDRNEKKNSALLLYSLQESLNYHALN